VQCCCMGFSESRNFKGWNHCTFKLMPWWSEMELLGLPRK
jgi:hypothetical protein